MPALAPATHEALDAQNKHVGVQLLHRAVAAEMQLLGMCCIDGVLFGEGLRSLSFLVGQACMHTLHAQAVSCSDECCAAMERMEFCKLYCGCHNNNVDAAASEGVPGCSRSTVHSIAYSLLNMMVMMDHQGFPEKKWPETLWLDREILASLRKRLQLDVSLAAVAHATIAEIHAAMPPSMDGIIKSQLLCEVTTFSDAFLHHSSDKTASQL